MLTLELAKEIVEQTMIRLNRNINIMNNKGIIIASGDSSRLNQLHFGAFEVLRTGEPLIITDAEMETWQGSLPGINLPIQFQNHIIGVIGITGNPSDILEFGELVKMITEMMIEQSFIAEQLEWKQRLKEQVFEELIQENNDDEPISQKLNLLGIKLEPPFHVGIIEIGMNDLKRAEFIKIFENILNDKQAIVGLLNVNRLFFLTSSLEENKLIQKLSIALNTMNSKKISIRIGIGSTVTHKQHIHHSFYEAQQTLRLGGSDQKLITFANIETKALIDGLDERSKLQFRNRILGNLSEKLIDTLDHFFAHNQNIGECAKSMYIHRNSLIYRIKQIKEQTDYDPQILNDAITLQLAVWIHRRNEKQ
jgi:carbohydrate diacid regulator